MDILANSYILQYPKKTIDPVELGMYRRSMPHIMKYAYENKDYALIKKMEACGVKIQYRRLAKMYKKDGNKELMEECYKKSVDAHEDYARYVYALRMEEAKALSMNPNAKRYSNFKEAANCQ